MPVQKLWGERSVAGVVGLLKRVAEIAVAAALYLVIGNLSLRLASLHPNTSPIWPTAGFALACLLVRGYRLAPAILLGSFAVNITTPVSALTSFAIAAGNTLEAMVTAVLIEEWARGRNVFERPVDVGKIVVCCFAPGAALSALIGVASLYLGGYAVPFDFRALWTTWWVGDSAGMLVVTPALVLWARDWREFLQPGEAQRSGVLYVVTIFIGMIAFSALLEQTPARTALAFLAVLPLMWAAVRRNPRDTATVALLLCAFAVWGTARHGGPFLRNDLNESFLLLVAFMIASTAPSLALSAEVVEQKRQKKHVDFVLRELSHRSKNLLAVVQSMASQVARRSNGFDSFYAGYTRRLQALAEIHDALVEGDWHGADIRDLVAKQMRPFDGGIGNSILANGPPLILNPQAAEQIGLALHELGTNAVKHGSLSVAGGTVDIRWEIKRDGSGEPQFCFSWEESGGPVVSEPERSGFGRLLLTRVVPETLRGQATFDFKPAGVRFALLAPAAYVLPIIKGVTAMAIHRLSEISAHELAEHQGRQRMTA
jgi:two-component sensor histidine kinase/integral membrane sensor domain MASE1